ncbi:AraC-type DNA-binding protein [Marinobacterium stanieri]|uniref:AraC-type DNA-binding protein n=2 Tax=Marinobacterium stanieri TaxID=49186 RepID=A0A1N6U4J6_9GAMM|nr:AraC-type DNA-binding protein [Marinobacterium stanieri]
MTSTNTPNLQARSSILLGFTEHCRRHRLNPMQLLARENLPPAVIRSQDLQIPYVSFVRILDHAAAESEYPLFAMTLSLRHGIEALGPLGLMACQCETLEDALRVVQKYLHFYAQGIHLDLVVEGRFARLVYDVDLGCDIDMTQLMEVGIGRMASVLMTLAPAGMNLSSVRLKHAPQAPLESYVSVLGLEPVFNADENSVSFPAQFLSQAPSPAPDRVRLYFESFMNRAGQNHSRPLKHQVIRLIQELIPTGEANADTVAKLMGIHTRSLQRQLKRIDTDFRSLMEEVRFKLAQDALRQSDTALTDVALQLGYSELSAFSRAFKRWSGLSPQHWRVEHAGSSGPDLEANSL